MKSGVSQEEPEGAMILRAAEDAVDRFSRHIPVDAIRDGGRFRVCFNPSDLLCMEEYLSSLHGFPLGSGRRISALRGVQIQEDAEIPKGTVYARYVYEIGGDAK